jgi:hypothetical protein
MGQLESAHQMRSRPAWFDSDTIFTTVIDARDLLDTSKEEELSPSQTAATLPASVFSLTLWTSIDGYTNRNGFIYLSFTIRYTISSHFTSQISRRSNSLRFLFSLRRRLQRQDLSSRNTSTSPSFKVAAFKPSVLRSEHPNNGVLHPETPWRMHSVTAAPAQVYSMGQSRLLRDAI